ncbi:MAG: KEOPS complex subunit Cgi121 [Nitrososphaerota archaeon]|jgi:tRNA threonylcarbamoyladenosine modification (KEOPS) complex Cgi121 subunit|uniref:KEOPS complex subunit Cgi121 n=1 Tax=Candidatus Bathycorpusculum sp. TaxID=2994959 RepID=UPI002833A51B|nr:KEOPS complex subunit Cgi121 [Candidatus Termitimicrobium sp.]MCL2432574.1 KEOPS complex subunit Cgi121 [Candidatus Termitimicrobium sp.]MDR0493025.1 KEOPS complex subunit Cgi121 [Nitrososphaerota archaeon]
MQYYIEEHNRYAEITGYQSITFEKTEAFLKTHRKQTTQQTEIQFFDAQLIASAQHLYFAVLNALQAFQNKTNISKSPAMETMLYASAERQIQKAIDRLGIKPQTKTLAIVIIDKDAKHIDDLLRTLTKYIGTEPDETVLEMTKEKETKIHQTFQITDTELETIADNKAETRDLVIERVALLASQL